MHYRTVCVCYAVEHCPTVMLKCLTPRDCVLYSLVQVTICLLGDAESIKELLAAERLEAQGLGTTDGNTDQVGGLCLSLWVIYVCDKYRTVASVCCLGYTERAPMPRWEPEVTRQTCTHKHAHAWLHLVASWAYAKEANCCKWGS
jgi:hypothetical protein